MDYQKGDFVKTKMTLHSDESHSVLVVASQKPLHVEFVSDRAVHRVSFTGKILPQFKEIKDFDEAREGWFADRPMTKIKTLAGGLGENHETLEISHLQSP